MSSLPALQSGPEREGAVDMPLERLSVLEHRLEDGYRRIGEAKQRGRSVPSWERAWLVLLREYELLSDELLAA
jgi:hypothetical protein